MRQKWSFPKTATFTASQFRYAVQRGAERLGPAYLQAPGTYREPRHPPHARNPKRTTPRQTPTSDHAPRASLTPISFIHPTMSSPVSTARDRLISPERPAISGNPSPRSKPARQRYISAAPTALAPLIAASHKAAPARRSSPLSAHPTPPCSPRNACTSASPS